MNQTNQTLRNKLEQIRKEQEFFREINLVEKPGSSGGSINLFNHELKINYDPEFSKQIIDADAKEYLACKNIPVEKALETLVCDLLHHEIGHRGSRKYPGCPGEAKALSSHFLDPIYKATKIENKPQLVYLANLLTDIIVDTTIKRLDNQEGVSDYTGFYLFLKEQGVLSKSDAFSKIYESFARLNLYFNGDKLDKELMRPYCTFHPEVNAAIGNFLQRTGIAKMKTDACQGSRPIKVRDRQAIRKYLLDESNWESLSTIFAEEFAKFLEEPPAENLFGSGGSIDQHDNGASSGSQQGSAQGGSSENEGKPTLEDGQESGNSPQNSAQTGGNLLDLIAKELGNQFKDQDGFGKELSQPDILKKIIRGRKAGLGPGWMTNFEYLVGYYEMLASDKLFEIKTPPQESKSYPLIDLGQLRFDHEDHAPNDIRGIFFDRGTKSMELYVAEHLHAIKAKVKKDIRDTPDLVFGLLDTSDSMLEKMPEGPDLGRIVNPKGFPQWQVNSKYHVSLIAYNMMVQRFSELGIYESDAYFANFSYETVVSKGLLNSKIEALSPQFGGTSIHLSKIENILSKKGTLVFTISDGEIGNDDRVLEKMVGISQYNPCFHVQIGKHSGFSRGLQKAGVYVKQVKQEKDLYDFVIDLTEQVYGEH